MSVRRRAIGSTGGRPYESVRQSDALPMAGERIGCRRLDPAVTTRNTPMLPSHDPRSLPWLYHLNSEPILDEEAYTGGGFGAEFRPIDDPSTAVMLPHAESDSALARLLATRRSCRAYAERLVTLEALATVLAHAYRGPETTAPMVAPTPLIRPVPSAGGLYPLEIDASVINVDGLGDGVYRYNVLHHCLERAELRPSRERLTAHLVSAPFVEHANVLFFIVATFDRCFTTYGPRGYRYALLEAGHVAQTLCLAASQQGLGSLCVGGFRDADLNRELGLDIRRQGVVYCVGIGYVLNASSRDSQPATA
jgi:SagB-type dehydrogenase family enzyme